MVVDMCESLGGIISAVPLGKGEQFRRNTQSGMIYLTSFLLSLAISSQSLLDSATVMCLNFKPGS